MLNKALKAQSIVEKIGKFNYIKNNIYHKKFSVKKVKPQARNWENIFVIYIPRKTLCSYLIKNMNS